MKQNLRVAAQRNHPRFVSFFAAAVIFLFDMITVVLAQTDSSHLKLVLPLTTWESFTASHPERNAISDGQGGAIVVGKARGLPYLIIQRIDRYGQVMWSEPGQARQVILDLQPGEAGYGPILLSDGQGGAFVAYAIADIFENNYDLYIQHFSATFERLWGDRGLVVAGDSTKNEYPLNLAPDGEGGVLLFYSGPSSTPYAATYVQRFDENGQPVWENNGNRLTDSRTYDYALPDGSGGAYLFGSELGGQHISSTGEFLWQQSAVPIGFDFGEAWLFFKNHNQPVITLVANSHFFTRVVTQQFSAIDGARLWGETGRYWMTPDSSKVFPVITENGKAGAFIFWRNVMQEMDSLGNFHYTNPLPVIERDGIDLGTKSAVFVEGLGAYAVYRGCPTSTDCYKLFLQWLTPNGELPWGITGRALIDSSVISTQPRILSDEEKKEAFVFVDRADGIYVQKIDLATGSIITRVNEKVNAPQDNILEITPNPFHDIVRFKYKARASRFETQSAKIYNILGQIVFDFGTYFNSSQNLELTWKGVDTQQRKVSPGVYFIRIVTGGSVVQKKFSFIK
jgi:hypothetical protein